MADENTFVALTNQTEGMLYLCVQYDGKFQEWPLAPNQPVTIDASKHFVVFIKSESGQCPE